MVEVAQWALCMPPVSVWTRLTRETPASGPAHVGPAAACVFASTSVRGCHRRVYLQASPQRHPAARYFFHECMSVTVIAEGCPQVRPPSGVAPRHSVRAVCAYSQAGEPDASNSPTALCSRYGSRPAFSAVRGSISVKGGRARGFSAPGSFTPLSQPPASGWGTSYPRTTLPL